jgi:hypothetical protein
MELPAPALGASGVVARLPESAAYLHSHNRGIQCMSAISVQLDIGNQLFIALHHHSRQISF